MKASTVRELIGTTFGLGDTCVLLSELRVVVRDYYLVLNQYRTYHAVECLKATGDIVRKE